jgi:hypothetical protein
LVNVNTPEELMAEKKLAEEGPRGVVGEKGNISLISTAANAIV